MKQRAIYLVIIVLLKIITTPLNSSFITNYFWSESASSSSQSINQDQEKFWEKDRNLLAQIHLMRWIKEIAISEKGYDKTDPQQRRFFSCLENLQGIKLNNNKKIILSMDGGGIRGTITITILMILKQIFEIELHHLLDLISGTSVGGIISATLCASDDGKNRKISLEEVYSLFMDGEATRLFSNKRIKNILDTMAKGLKVGSHIHSLYKTSDLVNLLSRLGETKLSRVLVPLMFTTVNEGTKDSFTIKSWKSKQKGGLDFYIRDMALATATVKPYFAVKEISPVNNKDIKFYLSDGGIYDLSPAKIAYESLAKYTGKPEDIVLLSLGTGTDIDPETGKSSFDINNQGIIKVLNNIAPDMIDICSANTHKKMLKKPHVKPEVNYFRLNPYLKDADRAVDNASQKNLRAMRDASIAFIKENPELIYKLVYVIARTKAYKFSGSMTKELEETPTSALTKSPKDPM